MVNLSSPPILLLVKVGALKQSETINTTKKVSIHLSKCAYIFTHPLYLHVTYQRNEVANGWRSMYKIFMKKIRQVFS